VQDRSRLSGPRATVGTTHVPYRADRRRNGRAQDGIVASAPVRRLASAAGRASDRDHPRFRSRPSPAATARLKGKGAQEILQTWARASCRMWRRVRAAPYHSRHVQELARQNIQSSSRVDDGVEAGVPGVERQTSRHGCASSDGAGRDARTPTSGSSDSGEGSSGGPASSSTQKGVTLSGAPCRRLQER